VREKLLCKILALDVPATTLPITHSPDSGTALPLPVSVVTLLAAIIIAVVAAILLLVIITKKNRRKT
jgi:hypothetical protein